MYLITSINNNQWNNWGESWLSSALIFSSLKPENIIVLTNSEKIISILKNKNIQIVFENCNSKIETILAISKYCQKNHGMYAYWESDSFFQDSIIDVFNLSQNKFVVSRNKDFGFCCASNHLWSLLEKIYNSFNCFGNLDFVSNFYKYYEHLLFYCEDEWDFTNINCLDLNDNFLFFNNNIQKAVRVKDFYKKSVLGCNYFYHERNKSLLNEFNNKKVFSFKGKKNINS